MPRRLRIIRRRKTKSTPRGVVRNYTKKTYAKSTRAGSIIRPQNNVPLSSEIRVRYLTTVQTLFVGSNNTGGYSGGQLNLNMSDPRATDLVAPMQSAISGTSWTFAKSNSASTGGQDNLANVLTDSNIYDKYDHFYVKKSVATVTITPLPNQADLMPFYGNQAGAPSALEVSPASKEGNLHCFGILSDRNTNNLVDMSVHRCQDLAGVKYKKLTVFPTSLGRACSFKLVYTPHRLGIKDLGDAKEQIGFTSQSAPAENTYGVIAFSKLMFANNLQSANCNISVAIDYQVVATERRITNNDPVIAPVHTGDL